LVCARAHDARFGNRTVFEPRGKTKPRQKARFALFLNRGTPGFAPCAKSVIAPYRALRKQAEYLSPVSLHFKRHSRNVYLEATADSIDGCFVQLGDGVAFPAFGGRSNRKRFTPADFFFCGFFSCRRFLLLSLPFCCMI
jgi:hypothetical protein